LLGRARPIHLTIQARRDGESLAGGGASTAQPGAGQPPENGPSDSQSDRPDLRAEKVWFAMVRWALWKIPSRIASRKFRRRITPSAVEIKPLGQSRYCL
jgi:hypothetical protein